MEDVEDVYSIMRIDDFKATFKDFLRPNRFTIEITVPPKLKLSGTDLKKVEMACKASPFSFHTISKVDQYINSINRAIANGYDTDPLQLTWLVDSDGTILKFFDDWSKLILTKDYKYGYFDDYAGDLTINWMDRAGNIIAKMKYKKVWPTNRDSIPLASDSNDTLAELNVSFFYFDKEMVITPVDTSTTAYRPGRDNPNTVPYRPGRDVR